MASSNWGSMVWDADKWDTSAAPTVPANGWGDLLIFGFVLLAVSIFFLKYCNKHQSRHSMK